MRERNHLRRLSHVWVDNPIYFITVCVAERKKLLAAPAAASVLIESWQAADPIHGWVVGRYVIMPDHVHFFARSRPAAKPLSAFMRDWKKWTTRRLASVCNFTPPLWQAEFFDHVLRSADSYSEKWEYVRNNPVRAGLAVTAEAWPYHGECEKLGF